MFTRSRKILRGVALFVALSVMQVYAFAGTAASPSTSDGAATISTQTGGTLRTTGNKAITVNGNNVRPGTTILSGSSIQTQAGVGATISLGFAEVEISPNSDLSVEFDAGSTVTVTLRRGCVILRTHGNTQGTLITPDGTSTKTGEARLADVCYNEGGAPIVNQGAAANAGAGAGASPVSGAGAVAGGSGISDALVAILIVAPVVITYVIIATRGENPSPSNP
jgi:hypothetical protein